MSLRAVELPQLPTSNDVCLRDDIAGLAQPVIGDDNTTGLLDLVGHVHKHVVVGPLLVESQRPHPTHLEWVCKRATDSQLALVLGCLTNGLVGRILPGT